MGRAVGAGVVLCVVRSERRRRSGGVMFSPQTEVRASADVVTNTLPRCKQGSGTDTVLGMDRCVLMFELWFCCAVYWM